MARAGINNNGPVVVHLADQMGNRLSDDVEGYSSSPTRLKFSNVRIPASPFPPLIHVRATNKSTVENSSAYVHSVLLVY